MRGRMADNQLTCRTCGSQFIPSVKTQVYCGRECKERRPRVRAPKKPLAEVHICLACEKPFHPKGKDRTRFCGRECGLSFTGLKSQLKATGGRVWVSSPIRRKCTACGARFTGQGAYCSPICRPTAYKAKSTGTCQWCGEAFCRTDAGASRHLCSEHCRSASRAASVRKNRASPKTIAYRKADKKRRKALARGADGAERVSPERVFLRDGWRCGICGKKTLPSKRGTTHPRAPELDHIVALALGGSHTYGNTMCACRSCNIAKGAAALGQLPLFAYA